MSGTIFGLTSTASLGRIDTYSLLDIYDHLDFDDLVNVALIDSHFSDLITRHYMIAKYRIHEKLIQISNNPDNATDHPDAVPIRNYGTILQFLQLFGHLITKLEFSHYYSDSEAPTINRFIAEHCSSSLTEITLKGVGVYLMSETKQRFEIFRVYSELSIDQIGSFVRENRNLTALLMPWTDLSYNYSIFFDIIGELEELEELRFRWSNNMDRDKLLHFMSEFQKLNRVTFCVHRNECEQLMGIIPQQWQFIQGETQKDCTFQRST